MVTTRRIPTLRHSCHFRSQTSRNLVKAASPSSLEEDSISGMWDPVSRKGEARGCFPNWGSGFPNMKGKPGLAKTFFEGTRSPFKETGLSSRKQTGSPFQNKTGCPIWETWSSLTGDCREAGSPFKEIGSPFKETGSHFREVGSFYLLTK